MSDAKWARKAKGKYTRTEGLVDAVVSQEDELWITAVYYNGQLRDLGEWDGRAIAFSNARAAMRRALKLRAIPVDAQSEDEDDDDC